MPTTWQQAAHTLSASTLQELIESRLAAVHIRQFATPAECQRLCQALRHAAIDRRAATTSPMTLIGSNFSNCRGPSKDDYFATVEPAYRDLQMLTEAAGFDPLQRLLARLSAVWPAAVGVATEPGYGRYFAGGIKTRVQGSPLHFDYVPRFTTAYRIGQINAQLSWNLYLEMPQNTGSTTIYNAPVEALINADPLMTYGLNTDPKGSAVWDNRLPPEQVDGAAAYTFRPEVGELVLFNTCNPHTVSVDQLTPGEWRAQAGSFIGRLADDSLVLWS